MGSKNTIEKYRPAIILGVNSRAMALCGEADLSALKNLIKELRYFIYKIVVKPTFTLEKTDDLPVDGIVVCLHESIVPPVLTQPKKCSFVNCIVNFFTR
jgi:hypothetical protein